MVALDFKKKNLYNLATMIEKIINYLNTHLWVLITLIILIEIPLIIAYMQIGEAIGIILRKFIDKDE